MGMANQNKNFDGFRKINSVGDKRHFIITHNRSANYMVYHPYKYAVPKTMVSANFFTFGHTELRRSLHSTFLCRKRGAAI